MNVERIALFFLGWLGLVLITVSLNYGAHFSMGWWWAMFWAGFGVLVAWMKEL